jgi:hypothetical protein
MWAAQPGTRNANSELEGRGSAPEFSGGFASDLPEMRVAVASLGSYSRTHPQKKKFDAELAATQPVLSRADRQAEQATFLPRIRANREVDLIF